MATAKRAGDPPKKAAAKKVATSTKAQARARTAASATRREPTSSRDEVAAVRTRAHSDELVLAPVGKGDGPVAAKLDRRLADYLSSLPPRSDREISVTDTDAGQLLVSLGAKGHEVSLLTQAGERITWPVPSLYPIDYERGRVELDARGRVLMAQRTEQVVLALDPVSRARSVLYRGHTGARGPWEVARCGEVLVLSNTDGLTLLAEAGARWVARSFLALRGFKQVVWDPVSSVLVVCIGDLSGSLHEVGVSGHRLVRGRSLEAKAPLRCPEIHDGRVFVRMGPSPRPRALFEVLGLARPSEPTDDARARLSALAEARATRAEPHLVPVDQEPPQRDADPSIHQRVSCAGGDVVVRDAIDRFTIALHRGGETMEIPTALRFPVVLDVDPSGTRVLVGVDRGARSEPLHELSVSSGVLATVTALSHPMGAYAGEAIGTVSQHGVWLVSRTGAIVAREEFSVDQAFGGHAIQHATGPSPQGRHVLVRMGDARATLAVFREDGVSLVRDVAEGVADVFTHHGVIHAVIDDVVCRLELG